MNEKNELFRFDYVKKLLSFKDENIIKILCGVRRCGKSTILGLFKQKLLEEGIEEKNIIQRLYTNLDFDDFDAKKMNEDLKNEIEKSDKSKKIYLLLDEVQEVENWEKCVNSLFESENVDIYITGSNSKLLSSEISTFLTGRFVLISIFTLSFWEFIDFRKNYGTENERKNLISEEISKIDKIYLNTEFDLYLKNGGFPFIAKTNHTQEENYQIVDGIYSTVVTRDISKRHKISNIEMFNRVVRFIFENLGKNFSAKTIFDFFKSQFRAISIETIYDYLFYLEEAFIIYRCNRFDIQGKNVLKTQEKYYLSDISLKYSLLGFNPKSIASVLENIVYLELKKRGFSVYIGKFHAKEIDFVAMKQDEKIYIQVCRTLPEDSERETENLKSIKDNYPKYIVVLDDSVCGNIDGIKIIHIRDFLLNDF